MNLQNIKTFCAVVEHQSISAAARALYISQPAVSAQLNRLEEDLGIQLISRKKGMSKIVLTQAGQAFLPLAQQWIADERQIRNFKETFQHKSLRVAASINNHAFVLPHITHKLMRKFPHIELQLLATNNSRERAAAIAERRLDVAIVFDTGSIPEYPFIRIHPFFSEGYYILCPADTLLPDRTIAPEELDPNFEVRLVNKSQKFNSWYRRHFREENDAYLKVDVLSTYQNYLTDPRCWAIVSAIQAITHTMQNPDRFTFRILDPAPPLRRYRILTSELYSETDIIDEFLRCCDEYVEERPYLQKDFAEHL